MVQDVETRIQNQHASVSGAQNVTDAMIPCLKLEDVTNVENFSNFRKPIVNKTLVNSILAPKRILRVYIESNSIGSLNDGDSRWELTVFAGIVMLIIILILGACCWCRKEKIEKTEPISEAAPKQSHNASTTPPLGFISRIMGQREKNRDSGSVDTANIRSVPLNQSRRSSWYNFGNMSNRGSMICGRRSSFSGLWLARRGKSVSEYCKESEILNAFLNHPKVVAKRITFDELRFIRILSKGAYGEVWLGQYETQQVAIKKLLLEKCQLTRSIEEFAGEIQLMCTLQHRNIVSLCGVSWYELQNLCAILEYMEAGDLNEVLEKNRERFTWQHEKISIAMDIAEGLVYLHSLRPVVVHRDLKSKNVLLDCEYHAKLSDFGVSRETLINETMTLGVGTLLWTAPEIIEGKKYSEKADIYSLGVVLSEMDTCEIPFSDVKSTKGGRLPGMQLAQLVRLGKIRVSLRDDCPSSLRELIMDCTQLDTEARPSSMQVAFTLKSIIAPMLRLSVSTATTSFPDSDPSSDATTFADCQS